MVPLQTTVLLRKAPKTNLYFSYATLLCHNKHEAKFTGESHEGYFQTTVGNRATH